MRLASCSKAFTSAAIQKLYDTHPSLPNTKGLSARWASRRPRSGGRRPIPVSNDITVQELVDHKGGWSRDIAHYDPVFDCRNIALLLGKSTPLTHWDMARYMYGEPLQFTPGSMSEYSNFGYVLLGLVVEKVRREDRSRTSSSSPS